MAKKLAIVLFAGILALVGLAAPGQADGAQCAGPVSVDCFQSIDEETGEKSGHCVVYVDLGNDPPGILCVA